MFSTLKSYGILRPDRIGTLDDEMLLLFFRRGKRLGGGKDTDEFCLNLTLVIGSADDDALADNEYLGSGGSVPLANNRRATPAPPFQYAFFCVYDQEPRFAQCQGSMPSVGGRAYIF